MRTFYKLRIEKIIRETEETITLCFFVPEELKKTFQFVSGQYINLQITLDGELLRRSYSICSGPDDDTLNVSVKTIKNGKFSVFANTHLKENALVEVSVPEGRFTLETHPSNKKQYLAIVAGSGITPVMSMVKNVLKNEPQSSFVLLYGNKSAKKSIFKDALDSLQQNHPNQLFVHYSYTEVSEEHHYSGRIDEVKLLDIIKNKYAHFNFDNCFICGPEALINLTKETLTANDFAIDKIKFELFTTTVTENNVSSSSGNCLAKVIVDDETFEVEILPNQTILDAVLKAGIDAPYSCQGGVCSSCIAKTSDGKAEMKKNTVLTAGEINSGLVLTCQALCQNETITVDYDDV